MHRFTCGERKICLNIKKSQNIMKVVVGKIFKSPKRCCNRYCKESALFIDLLFGNVICNVVNIVIKLNAEIHNMLKRLFSAKQLNIDTYRVSSFVTFKNKIFVFLFRFILV